MPLRSARIRPTTAACKPAAQTAADCRRQSGVTTAAPPTAVRVYAALGTTTRALCPGQLGSLVLVPIGATPTVLGVCPPFLCSRRPVLPSGVSSLHTPPGCVGLLPPGYTCTLTRFGVVKYVSVGLVGWWGRVVARPRPPRRAGATPIFMTAKRPRAGGCDVARPPAPLCLWRGSRAGSWQWGGLCKRAGPQLKPPRL